VIDQSQPGTVPPSHEPVEANVRAVWITGAVLAGIVAATFLLIFGLQHWLEDTDLAQQPLAANQQESITDPQWNVPHQVQQLRTKEQKYLTTYGWVDQMAGIARVPLDRALEIIAKDGLPVTIGSDVQTDSQNTNE
jgi:hypothetical protein